MASRNAEQEIPSAAEPADELAELRAENAALRDRLLRALAEAENTRRLAERSGEDARQYAIVSFARELLPVEDNLRRAVQTAEQRAQNSIEDSAWLEGVRATERLLMNVFERFGIRRIEALGQSFDPQLHEAMMEVEDPNYPPGAVVRVLEDGYTLHDRLLRPARVAVNKRRQSDAPLPEVETPGIAPQNNSSQRQ